MSRPHLPLLLATLSGLVAASCNRQPLPTTDEARLLVIDGIEVRVADLAPYLEFFDSFLPEAGRKVKVQRVLDDHLLPLQLARRSFAEPRQKLLAEARQLCEVATNFYELEQQTTNVVYRKRLNQTRLKPRLPVSMFLFDPLRTGAVSAPIEVPQGWIVASAFELHESPLKSDDYVDGLQVAYFTHSDQEWLDWYAAQKLLLADKVTFVHPDYREAMPAWMHLPERLATAQPAK
ncbi:MAG: hypothetical protein JNN13_09615 [Planctomycetes bacterium]|nr:hypothetical protein [Planctomycetota bacterium]